jgi:hypothetical protein
MQTTIVCVTAVKRIAFTLVAIAVIAANVGTRQAVTAGTRRYVSHGCQAAPPAGKAGTIEAADVAIAVQHAAATQGSSIRTGDVPTPATHASSVRSAFTFARPHDPQHLHPFSLLI